MQWIYNRNYGKQEVDNNEPLYDVLEYHRSMKGYYSKTPEIEIEKGVYIKDESQRMHTTSFKILGVSYAVYELYKSSLNKKNFDGLCEYFRSKHITFVTATDGNLGVAMSFLSSIINQKCIVFIPKTTPSFYTKKIQRNGAKVVFCDGNYDECVQKAIDFCQDNEMNLILDTAVERTDISNIPLDVIKGYSTIFLESELEKYDYLFAPAGVGGLIASAIYCNLHIHQSVCKIISVEPEGYNSIQKSIMRGEITKVQGKETIMNGLKCGIPSLCAWEFIQKGLYGSICIDDIACVEGKRELEQIGVKTGYTGASAYAGYKVFCRDNVETLKNKRVLILNTECSDY